MSRVPRPIAADPASVLSVREDAILELGGRLNALLAAGRSFSLETAALFEPALSMAALQIVQCLYANGPMRSMQIAQHLAMDRSALSRLLGQLAADELVESRADAQDKRATFYSLTNLARERMEAAFSLKGSRFAQRMEGWSEDEIRQLSAFLSRLTEGIA